MATMSLDIALSTHCLIRTFGGLGICCQTDVSHFSLGQIAFNSSASPVPSLISVGMPRQPLGILCTPTIRMIRPSLLG